MMDWSACPDVERNSDKVSGAWLIKGTRIPADAVLDNADDGFTAQQIASDIYEGLTVDLADRVIAFARSHAARAA